MSLKTDPGKLRRCTNQFHCSGVLPYCSDGTHIYFILGKTRNCKLLTFTGKAELSGNSELGIFEDPCTTAAREMYEETLGAIMGYEHLLEATRSCDKDHVIVSSTPKGTLCYTFLIEVPYRRHYSICFSKIRSFLEFINIKDRHLCEFQELKAVCFDTLVSKIRYTWKGSGMITTDEEWGKITSLAPPHMVAMGDTGSSEQCTWRSRHESTH